MLDAPIVDGPVSTGSTSGGSDVEGKQPRATTTGAFFRWAPRWMRRAIDRVRKERLWRYVGEAVATIGLYAFAFALHLAVSPPPLTFIEQVRVREGGEWEGGGFDQLVVHACVATTGTTLVALQHTDVV